MCSISAYVNISARHDGGCPPRQNPALQAFVAAHLLRHGRLVRDRHGSRGLYGLVAQILSRPRRSFFRAKATVFATDILVGRRTC